MTTICRRVTTLWLILVVLAANWTSAQPPTAGEPGANPKADLGRSEDFEVGVDRWTGMDDQSKVAVSTETPAGKQCLEYSYTVGAGMPVLTWNGIRVQGMKGITMQVRTNVPTLMGIALLEDGGGRYQTMFRTSTAWTKVELSIDEFAPAADAPDGNGQLDTDQVHSIAFLDLAGFLFKDQAAGPRKLWLDEVTCSRDAPASTLLPNDAIETFERPLYRWAAVRAALPPEELKIHMVRDSRLLVSRDAKVGNGSLSLTYTPVPGSVHALLGPSHLLRQGDVHGLEFWLKTSVTTAVLVMLLGDDGSEYASGVLSPANQWQLVTLPLSSFATDRKDQDENGHLDPSQIAAIMFSDLGVALSPKSAKQPRTLWLDEVRVVREPVPAISRWEDDAHRRFIIDDVANPIITWAPVTIHTAPLALDILSGAEMSITAGVGDTFAVQASYTTTADSTVGLIRQLKGLPAIADGALVIRARVDGVMPLYVSLKERDDSEYEAQTEIPEGEGWQAVRIPLTAFALKQGSTDENQKLDTGQLKEMTLIDIGPLQGVTGDNTLTLDAVALVKDQ